MSCSALILAGGMGRRLGFKEKALIDINGRPLITLVIESLEKIVDNIIISVRDEAQGELLNSRISGCWFAYDAYKNRGPLAGVLSGLYACKDEYCFIAACDMPFINSKVVKMLFKECEEFDAAIPCWKYGLLEPLHAVYRCESMIKETKKAIEKGENIILAPVSKLRVNYVAVDDIKKIDPKLKTFMNVNTPEEKRIAEIHLSYL
jgi:molybdopterin-guanine dinucleotide biosynthesis protein A